MKAWFKKTISFFKDWFNYCKLKRYDTMAGTMSFFFLLSAIPLLYLCISLYVNAGTLFGLETPIPEEIKDYISFDVSAGASIFFFITTIYSSSKFFLQLRKSSEIIYDIKEPRTGITETVVSCILVIFTMLVVSGALLGIAFSNKYLSSYPWAQVLIQLISYLLFGSIFFALITFVNFFANQVKGIKFKQLLPGILFSFVWSILLSSLFGIYLGFTSYDALYGIFATVIIAAVYVNFLMQGIVVGIVINERKNKHLLQLDENEEDPTMKLIGKVAGKVKKLVKKDKAEKREEK